MRNPEFVKRNCDSCGREVIADLTSRNHRICEDCAAESADTTRDALVKADGVSLIAQERQRQIEVENWTPEHDDEHQYGELSKAAAVYTLLGTDAHTAIDGEPERSAWPWAGSWFKPTTRLRDLVKAGALIAAEIDRIQRLEAIETAIAEEGKEK